jgi:copper chaperone NosL
MFDSTSGGLMLPHRLSVAFLLVSLAFSFAFAGELKQFKASPKDKCPVCGMFVAKYPDFLARITFKDGSYALFDGTKDMIKYYLEMPKYEKSRKKSDILSIHVTDYYSLGMVDGQTAFYVIGSDITGPMGNELISFGNEGDAKEFKIDHKGKKIVRFKGVTIQMLRELD